MTDLALLIFLDSMASIVSHIRMFRGSVMSLIVMIRHSFGMENRQTVRICIKIGGTLGQHHNELVLDKFTVLNVVTVP